MNHFLVQSLCNWLRDRDLFGILNSFYQNKQIELVLGIHMSCAFVRISFSPNLGFGCPYQPKREHDYFCLTNIIALEPVEYDLISYLYLLKSQLAPVNIYCDQHPEMEVDYYCKRHVKLVCNKCALVAHADQSLVQVERFGVENFCERVRIKLNLLKNKILEVCDVLNTYKICEKAFGGEEFLHLVNDAQGILLPHLRSQQEKYDIEFLRDGMPVAIGKRQESPSTPELEGRNSAADLTHSQIPKFQTTTPPPLQMAQLNQDIQPLPPAKPKSKIELLLDWLQESEQSLNTSMAGLPKPAPPQLSLIVEHPWD